VKERFLPISIVVRPVTQTAEADVKRASTKLRCPFVAEKGSHSKNGADKNHSSKN